METLLYFIGGALAAVAICLVAAGIVAEERARRRLIERARSRPSWPRPRIQLIEDPPALQRPKVIGRIGGRS